MQVKASTGLTAPEVNEPFGGSEPCVVLYGGNCYRGLMKADKNGFVSLANGSKGALSFRLSRVLLLYSSSASIHPSRTDSRSTHDASPNGETNTPVSCNAEAGLTILYSEKR